MTLRKPELELEYIEFLKTKPDGCPFCEQDLLVKEYKDWVILNNRFPYNLIAEKHDILCPRRHISKLSQLTINEMTELYSIVKSLQKKYSYWSQNMPKERTVPAHLHFHLIKIYGF